MPDPAIVGTMILAGNAGRRASRPGIASFEGRRPKQGELSWTPVQYPPEPVHRSRRSALGVIRLASLGTSGPTRREPDADPRPDARQHYARLADRDRCLVGTHLPRACRHRCIQECRDRRSARRRQHVSARNLSHAMRLGRAVFPKLIHWGEPTGGGHFAAFEEPADDRWLNPRVRAREPVDAHPRKVTVVA